MKRSSLSYRAKWVFLKKNTKRLIHNVPLCEELGSQYPLLELWLKSHHEEFLVLMDRDVCAKPY